MAERFYIAVSHGFTAARSYGAEAVVLDRVFASRVHGRVVVGGGKPNNGDVDQVARSTSARALSKAQVICDRLTAKAAAA